MDQQDRPSIQPEIERRQYRRVKLVTQIQFDLMEPSQIVLTRDISLGGMFISVPEPIPVDTELSIAFRLFPEEPTIKCRARVMYSRIGLGMGIQFLGLDEPSLRSPRRFIDKVS